MSAATDKLETGLFIQEETANSAERMQRLIEILDQAFADRTDPHAFPLDDAASPEKRSSTVLKFK